MSATKEICEFVHDSHYENLPQWAIEESKRTLLNFIAISISASESHDAQILYRWANEEGAQSRSTVIKGKFGSSPSVAALVNGFLGHLQDYDDTHFPTILHPTSVVWPAVLAAAEDKGANGHQVLTAFTLGAEVACRVAISVHPWHYDQGWHITGTAGIFGAVAGAGKILELNPQEHIYAMGNGGTLASGVREVFGSHTKPIHPGHSASSGLRAAYLANYGLNSADDIIGGRTGFWAVLSPNGHSSDKLLGKLGEHWEFWFNGIKPYANGVVSHPLQDAIIQLKNKHNLDPSRVASIHAKVHYLVPELMGHRNPRRGLEGKFSFYHCIAAGLVDGAGHDAQFSDERVAAEDIEAIRKLITYEIDDSYSEDEAHLTVKYHDEEIFDIHIDHATGSPENRMTDQFLQEKYFSLVNPVIGNEKSERILALVSELEHHDSFDELMRLIA